MIANIDQNLASTSNVFVDRVIKTDFISMIDVKDTRRRCKRADDRHDKPESAKR